MPSDMAIFVTVTRGVASSDWLFCFAAYNGLGLIFNETPFTCDSSGRSGERGRSAGAGEVLAGVEQRGAAVLGGASSDAGQPAR